jgi:hypothetical protein
MGQIASTTDVASRLGRTLTTEEHTLVATLIYDVENMLKVRAPDKDLNNLDPTSVQQVVANAVVRVLRNPDGYRSESAGGISYTVDTRAAAGFLTILDEEWRLLGLSSSGGAYSIAPSLGLPRSGFWPGGPCEPGWWPWC